MRMVDPALDRDPEEWSVNAEEPGQSFRPSGDLLESPRNSLELNKALA
jgi:hypothetical protein